MIIINVMMSGKNCIHKVELIDFPSRNLTYECDKEENTKNVGNN